MAKALAVYHSGAATQEQAKLGALWRVLENSDKNYPTLNDAINGISNALKEVANDRKFQKSLNAHVEANGAKEFKSVVISQEKIVNELVEEKKKPVPAAKVEEAPRVSAPPTPAPVVEEKKPEPEPVAEKVEKKPEVIVEKVPTPIQEEVKNVDGEKPAQEKKGDRLPKKDNRERPYKGKGDGKPRGPRKDRPEGERPEGERERKQYKPKYQEKKVEGEERQRGESSSSSSSSEARQFKKDEIRKLEDEGFTVVGKPKPKAKDAKERRAFHDHQHGKKHHHTSRPE